MYPTMVVDQNIFGYIFQGILFNYKYIISNIIAVCIINVIIMIKNIYVEKINKKCFERA